MGPVAAVYDECNSLARDLAVACNCAMVCGIQYQKMHTASACISDSHVQNIRRKIASSAAMHIGILLWDR